MDPDKLTRELKNQLRYAQLRFDSLHVGVKTLACANVGVFLASRTPGLRRAVARHTTLSWDSTVRSRRLHTLATSVFAHGSLFHLGLNTYGLVLLAPLLEQSMDWRRQATVSTGTQAAAFVVASGILANICGLVLCAVIPPLRSISAVGMSGGLYSAIAVVAQANPDMEWQVLFVPKPVSSETFLTCLVGMDVAGLCFYLVGVSSGIAHHMHLAGACIGAASVQYLLPKRRRQQRVSWW